MSTPIVQALLAELDDDALDELAARLAPRLSITDSPAGDLDHEALLTTEQVARRVGCHARTVSRAVLAGQLEASKVAGRWRITPAAVDAWLTTGQTTDTRRLRLTRRTGSHTTLKEALTT